MGRNYQQAQRGIQNPLQGAMNRARNAGGGVAPADSTANGPMPSTTPFDTLVSGATKIGNVINNALNKLNSSGSRRSPTTHKDS